MGGENGSAQDGSQPPGGSSPRGRGKPYQAFRRQPDNGLIPAWAGKTRGRCARSRTRPAHPRVGGENAVCFAGTLMSVGSSPRGRGKHGDTITRIEKARLIPAWAGKTRHGRSPGPPHRAHPRVGGENSKSQPAPAAGKGSSPRGRGKRIPAPLWPSGTLAHPRVGGENPMERR